MLQVLSDRKSCDDAIEVRGMAQEPMPDRPRVLVVSDTILYRDALALGLAQTGTIEIVGTSDSQSVFDQLSALCPTVLVVDCSLIAGATISRIAQTTIPEIKVVLCAMSGGDDDFLSWAEAGISGYLGPNGSMQDLVSAIQLAARGEGVCSPRLTGLLLDRIARLSAERPRARGGVHVLTTRENEVLELVAEGLANKVIARRLHVTEATVKNHVHAILEKLGVGTRGAAAALLRRETSRSVAGMDRASRLAAPDNVYRLAASAERL